MEVHRDRARRRRVGGGGDLRRHDRGSARELSHVHPTAIVAPGASVGNGAQIGPWCTVGADVIVDPGARLISNVVVDGHTRIGAGAVLYPFCTVGSAPQDLKYRGEPTRCEIGAQTQIREFVTVNRGTSGGAGVTVVGEGCLLMACSHVAHDCELGRRVVIVNNSVMGGHVVIGDHAIVGGASAIHQHVRIGQGAIIGGMSGVERDVIPFGSVTGNRASLDGLNIVGLKRRGHQRAAIHALRAAFRELFLGTGVFADRVAEVRARFGHEALVQEVL
ncbi:MAG: acyl-ACP--UDP-N-acetylglucosamine O-acyltransferase, partial [Acidisphaera sp.]|nr:acyl-ACP--UDP-N-acetylglucosamine O-acyltransferase [Acidisphaera sp.]